MKTRFAALLAIALCAGAGTFAAADPIQPPQGIPTIPPALQNNPYVQSIINSLGGMLQSTNGNHAQGKVTFFKRFELQVQTAPRVYREVRLHQGTAINPRGMTLAPGQMVEVDGVGQSDGSLNADSITVR